MRPLERAHKFCRDYGLEIAILMVPMKQLGIKWFTTVTSVSKALKAEEVGADALVVQGADAGGHRGNFISAHDHASGLMAVLPIMCDARCRAGYRNGRNFR
jgi:nitronate monooxygenase